ncbi:MAG: hypothetical protein ACREFR_07770 [Limisphaerales bacterium]
MPVYRERSILAIKSKRMGNLIPLSSTTPLITPFVLPIKSQGTGFVG